MCYFNRDTLMRVNPHRSLLRDDLFKVRSYHQNPLLPNFSEGVWRFILTRMEKDVMDYTDIS